MFGTAVDKAIAALDSGEARIAEKIDGDWIVHQWLKKAVLLSFRLNPMELIAGGPGGANWWDKVPSKFAGLGREGVRSRGLPRGSRRDRPPRRLHRARRGPDAELRQHRRPRRRRHDGRHLGDGRKLRADRPQRPYLGRRRNRRRARAASGRAGDHRGRLLHRRALRSRRGCRSSSRARSCRWACSSAHRPRSSTARRAKSITAECPPTPSSFRARLPGKDGGPALACAVIVKRVDERTRSKTSINELLRD